ncbi:hypothetical protein IF2G_04980 [Cordyceps javanica]|nr:hypothetical protein IF2G_04980 [Cordyceps javanica]
MVIPGSAKVDPASVAQAEERYFKPTYMDVRSWVRRRARDYILAYFHLISEPCKDAYSMHLDTIKATCFAHYNAPPTAAHYASAERDYRTSIDLAWTLAVKRYPEVLNYFYSLVQVSLPDDDDPAVKCPPMDRLGDLRHSRRRVVGPRNEAPTPNFPFPPLPPHAGHWQTPPSSPRTYGPGHM